MVGRTEAKEFLVGLGNLMGNTQFDVSCLFEPIMDFKRNLIEELCTLADKGNIAKELLNKIRLEKNEIS